jgi:hypothetical protein
MNRLVKKSEKQVGPIYNFVSLNTLMKILNTDTLSGNYDKYGKSISFTRNKNLWFENRAVRIEVDGNMLSNTYHIEPFNFFPEEGAKPQQHENESEERVWESQISPFKQYITQITLSSYRAAWTYNPLVKQALGKEHYTMKDVAQFIQSEYGINVEVID